MEYSNTLKRAIKGTAAVSAMIVAAPIFGPVGTITATGFTVSAIIGSASAVVEET